MGLTKADLGILVAFATNYRDAGMVRFDTWSVNGGNARPAAVDVYVHRFWEDELSAGVTVEHHMSKVLRRFKFPDNAGPTSEAETRAEARVYCNQAEEAYWKILRRMDGRKKEANGENQGEAAGRTSGGV